MTQSHAFKAAELWVKDNGNGRRCWPIPWRASAPSAPPVDRLIGRASLPASRLWFRGQTAAAQQELRPTGVSNGAKFTARNGCEGPQPREDRRKNSVRSV